MVTVVINILFGRIYFKQKTQRPLQRFATQHHMRYVLHTRCYYRLQMVVLYYNITFIYWKVFKLVFDEYDMVLEVIVLDTAGTILYSVCECIRFVLFCMMLCQMYCIITQFGCNTTSTWHHHLCVEPM